MEPQTLLELRTLAAWVAGLAMAWYATRLAAGIPLVLLGARRGSTMTLRCGVRLLPRGIRPAVARWAAGPALGLGLAVLGGPGISAALECPPAGLAPLDRLDPCTTQPIGTSVGAPTGLAPEPPAVPAGEVATVDPPSRETSDGLTVRPGDSLWSITADSLGTTSPGVLADAWPELYRANQELIGPDPGLIHPGMTLSEPANWSGEKR